MMTAKDTKTTTNAITWYVATLGAYVLVEATDENEARRMAEPGLANLYANIRARLGSDAPVEIRTVRPATADEIALMDYHERMTAAERQRS